MIPIVVLSSRINVYSFMPGAVLTLTFNNIIIIKTNVFLPCSSKVTLADFDYLV